MEELRKLESELNSFYNELDGDDPCEMDFKIFSTEEKEECHNKIIKLQSRIDEIYREKLKQLEAQNPAIKNNDEVQKLYDKNEKDNYLIFNFLIDHPEIYSSTYITSEVGRFIYHINELNKRDTGFVMDKISVLSKIQPTFFHYTKFVAFLNNFYFDYLYDYFTNEVFMSNTNFINFLLEIIQDPHKNIDYEEYHTINIYMENALNDDIDLEFIYSLGNEKKYKKYLSSHSKQDLFNIINNISDNSLKQKVVADIFDLKNKNNLHILVDFLTIPEIQSQLLDENSFYYKLLIECFDKYTEDRNNDEDFNEKDFNTGYASIKAVLYLFPSDFWNYKIDQIIHHFDQYVNNYIYFYYENEVKKVPVLFYIQEMKRKIYLCQKMEDLYLSMDTEIAKPFLNTFSQYIEADFIDIAQETLEENMNMNLAEKDEEYWSYLLKEAETYEKANDEEKILSNKI